MKYYAITWMTANDTATDLIKTEMSFEALCEYYYRDQAHLTIMSIRECVPHFSELARDRFGEYTLDGVR